MLKKERHYGQGSEECSVAAERILNQSKCFKDVRLGCNFLINTLASAKRA